MRAASLRSFFKHVQPFAVGARGGHSVANADSARAAEALCQPLEPGEVATKSPEVGSPIFGMHVVPSFRSHVPDGEVARLSNPEKERG